MHSDGLGPETFGVWRSEFSPSGSGQDALKLSVVKRMFFNCLQDRNKTLYQIRNENNNKHNLFTSDKEVIKWLQDAE